jgi:nucleotide-binding universal stress UspA family protein
MSGKIMIGFEPTEQGEDAVALAEVLCEVLAATPVVVQVMPWPRYLMDAEDYEAALAEATKTSFATLRDRLAPLNPQTRAVADPSAAEALYALAEQERASLLVIGSTHRGSVGRTLLGSVGESLLHGAPCAVAVAPKGFAAREARRVLELGVAFDGSPESWTALETAIGLSERLHAKLKVFTVAEVGHYGYATSLSVLTAAEFHDYELEDKQRILDLALNRAPAGLPIEGRPLRGSAAPALTEAAAASDLDLLVLGSRGYGPIKRTLLGSVSAAVIRSAPCPVLVLPRAAGIDPLGLDVKARPMYSTAQPG